MCVDSRVEVELIAVDSWGCWSVWMNGWGADQFNGWCSIFSEYFFLNFFFILFAFFFWFFLIWNCALVDVCCCGYCGWRDGDFLSFLFFWFHLINQNVCAFSVSLRHNPTTLRHIPVCDDWLWLLDGLPSPLPSSFCLSSSSRSSPVSSSSSSSSLSVSSTVICNTHNAIVVDGFWFLRCVSSVMCGFLC